MVLKYVHADFGEYSLLSKNTFIFRSAMCLVLFFGIVCVASGDDEVEGEIPSKVFFVKANSLLDSRSSYSSASALWTPDGHLIQEEPLADADLILMLFSDPDAGAELSSSLDEPEEDYIKSRNSDSGLSFSQSGGRNSSSHSSITGSDPSPADQFPDVSAGWFLVSEVVNKEPSPFQLLLSSLMNRFFASSTRVDSFNSPGDQIVEQVTKNQRGEDLRRLFSRSLLHIVEDVVVEGTPRVRIVQIRDHIQQELEEAYRSARQGGGVVAEYQPLALYRAEMRGRVRQIAYASESGLNRRSSVGAGRLEVLFETIDDLMRLSQARLEYQGVEEELTSVTRPIYQAGFQDVVQPRFRLESRTGEDLMSVLAPIFRNYQLDGRDVLEGRTAYFLSAHLFLAGLEYETLDIGRPHSAEMSQEKKLSEDPLKVTREEEGFISNGVRMDTIHALRESTRLPSDERVWTGEALVYPLERAGGGHPFGRNSRVPGAQEQEREVRHPVQVSDQEQEGVSNGRSELTTSLQRMSLIPSIVISNSPYQNQQGASGAVVGSMVAHGTPKPPPRHPEYVEDKVRFESFQTFLRRNSGCTPAIIEGFVKSGFFYTGQADLVRCFHCGIGLKDFAQGENPLEHIRHSLNGCPFLVDQLGAVEVARRREALEREVSDSASGHRESSPVHRNYETLESRLATFASWPQDAVKTPDELANAGLYYTGEGDVVRCFSCNGGFGQWHRRNDPWTEHARWFPTCRYLRDQRGEESIAGGVLLVEMNDEEPDQAMRVNSRRRDKTKFFCEGRVEEILKKLGMHPGERVQNCVNGYFELSCHGDKREIGDDEIIKYINDHKENMEKLNNIELEVKTINKKDIRAENLYLEKIEKCQNCEKPVPLMFLRPCGCYVQCKDCMGSKKNCPECGHVILEKITVYRG